MKEKASQKTRVLISIKAACTACMKCEQEAIVQTFATRWSTEHNGGCHIGFQLPEKQKK